MGILAENGYFHAFGTLSHSHPTLHRNLLKVSCLFSSFLQYANVDHTLEECTSNWNVHIPCHYLVLWLRFHGPESLYDKREFIMIFCILFIIITSIFLVRTNVFQKFIHNDICFCFNF